MTETQTDWCVYDLETEKVIGSWKKYEDALQFWGDVLNSDDENWVVFPAKEIPVEAFE